MLGISEAGLAIVLGLLIPFLWSGCVKFVRVVMAGTSPLSDRSEKALLGLMVLPMLAGFVAALHPGIIPPVPSALPLLGEPDLVGVGLVDQMPLEEEEAFRLTMPWGVLLTAYLMIVGALLVRIGGGLFRMRQLMRSATPLQGKVLVTDVAISPMALPGGVVLLPKGLVNAIDDVAIEMICAHERAHIERKDPLWFLVMAFVDALAWFNPFIRQQTARCRLAAELDCDARALGQVKHQRKDYANLLVRVLKEQSLGRAVPVPGMSAPGHKGDIAMRLGHIMNPSSRNPRRAAGIVMALGIAVLPLGGWQLAHAANSAPEFTVRPLEGRLTSEYGERVDPVSGTKKFHHGTDIAAPMGTPILAPADGKVIFVGERGAYGNVLEIDHGDGVITRYSQLKMSLVEEGDQVSAGTKVAKVGSSGRSTGPHLHVEVFVNAERVDPATVLDLPRKEGR